MPPHDTGPGKYPTQHFLPTVSFLFCEAVPFTPALHHCSLCVLLSPIPVSLCLVPSFLSFWLSYFITISPFSAGLIFTSSTSQKFSALNLAVGPFWVSGSHIIYSAGLLTGYSGCVPGFEPVRPEMGHQGEELSLCSGNWGVYFEGCGNRWAPVSSGNWQIFMTRCAWFCLSDEKRLKHPMDSTSLEDIRKTREEHPMLSF